MSHPDWMIRGPEVATCNCNWGCPCQFNSLPTHGDCRAAMAMRIDEGHFGGVRLDGAVWAAMYAWPEAIHLGNGECQYILDEGMNEYQRDALLQILSGDTSEPGATFFNVFAATFTTVHDPINAPIEFSVDMAASTGHFSIPDYVEGFASPILNPVTGESHRARVVLPAGFEYTEAEFVSSKASGKGVIGPEWNDGHGHIAGLHLTAAGPVR